MLKNDYIKAVAEKTGRTQKDVREIIDGGYEVLCENVVNEPVKIMDAITVECVERAPHTSRNPKTGEAVEVPAKRVPHVKIGKNLKDRVSY